MTSKGLLTLVIGLSLFSACKVTPGVGSGIDQATVKWYNSKDWLNGLQYTPHKSINKEQFAKSYNANKERWDKAFAFMKNTDLQNLKPGDYPIDGDNVYARVTEVFLKNIDSSKWEIHKNFDDIHYVISGREKIGIGPLSSATIIVPYDTKKDIAFLTGKGDYYTAKPGTFFIATTADIHRPGLEVQGKEKVKKLLIKIKSTNSN